MIPARLAGWHTLRMPASRRGAPINENGYIPWRDETGRFSEGREGGNAGKGQPAFPTGGGEDFEAARPGTRIGEGPGGETVRQRSSAEQRRRSNPGVPSKRDNFRRGGQAKKPAFGPEGSGEDFKSTRPGTRIGEDSRGRTVRQRSRAEQRRRTS